ncbi:Non-structural maintenance of chromosomes element 1 [Cinnamomum micranthum f. kanehirae]|uniref:Non-structural maintenance of chromosomes element 1 n=1 Tax=Cinnamomum micranthum f. kanehirae TaxID=337451 RepID=A0A3S4NDS8_9MAGN|nr:Non-structural maintenance of chromosomes element 1 [Cinnamomum micranthum f. kanehirae]
MDSFSAEDLPKIGGIATVSLLHSFIPTHWLPFSIVGRAQKWDAVEDAFCTAFGAVLHVISTSLLGITAITMANTIAGEENSP